MQVSSQVNFGTNQKQRARLPTAKVDPASDFGALQLEKPAPGALPRHWLSASLAVIIAQRPSLPVGTEVQNHILFCLDFAVR
jgi:hypothetical protein